MACFLLEFSSVINYIDSSRSVYAKALWLFIYISQHMNPQVYEPVKLDVCYQI